MPSSTVIKQIAAGRRKPNMTRKEYFDHRFRIHGSLSDGTEDKDQKPHKYIQTQIFDSVFGLRPGGPPNANQNWCGRDDTTELFFRDWHHVRSCFTSDYVKQKIAPDGPFFADFESSIIMMAYEKPCPIRTRLASEKANVSLDQGDATVAMYFISAPNNRAEGKELESILTPALTNSLEKHCQDEVWGVIANIGAVSDQFDLRAYFGGDVMPQVAVVYKVFLKSRASVPAFRRSQVEFQQTTSEEIDQGTSFVVFSEEALVLDVGQNIRASTEDLIKAFRLTYLSSRSTDNPPLKIFLVLVTLEVKMSDLLKRILRACDSAKSFVAVDDEDEDRNR